MLNDNFAFSSITYFNVSFFVFPVFFLHFYERFIHFNLVMSNELEWLMLVLCACSTEISLKQRLEYISRAILSAKSSSCASSLGADGEFLHELEEKMEVMTQKQLLVT